MCAECHVVTLDLEIKDLGALKTACDRLHWQLREGVSQYRWAGYWADDSPVPRHVFESDAHVAQSMNWRNHRSEERNREAMRETEIDQHPLEVLAALGKVCLEIRQRQSLFRCNRPCTAI
jgi:hypothetical protein